MEIYIYIEKEREEITPPLTLINKQGITITTTKKLEEYIIEHMAEEQDKPTKN